MNLRMECFESDGTPVEAKPPTMMRYVVPASAGRYTVAGYALQATRSFPPFVLAKTKRIAR